MTRIVRWSTTLAAAAGGFLVGVAVERLVVDWSSYAILGVGLSLLSLAAGGLVFEWWRTRPARRASEDHELATRADRFRGRQERHRTANELRAFWASPEGQWVYHMPAAINDTVRIQPIEDKPRDPLATGQLSLQLDEDRMAVVDIDLTRRQLAWRDRVVHAAVWLANRPWWVGRPTTARLFYWVFLRFGVRRIRRVKRAGSSEDSPEIPPESLDPPPAVG